MYLSKLSKKQKALFLEVCASLSVIDNEFAEEEKNVIDQLCEEMRIKPKYNPTMDINEAVSKIASISNPREKKMIAIELIGLVMADGKVADEEKSLMKIVFNVFGLMEKDLDEAIVLVGDLYSTYNKFASFIDR